MLLQVGSKGKVIFKAPFDKYNSDIEWTIISIQTIPHLKAFGIDVFALVYEKEELAESDYNDDITNNISIVAFSNDSQEILYVPVDRVDLTAVEYSYEYIEKGLAIPLPSMPVTLDLTGLKNDIKVLVKEKTSYDVNVEEVNLSGITLVNEIDNTLFINAFNNGVVDKRDYRTKYLEEVEKNNILTNTKNELEALVIRLKNNQA